MHGSYRDNSFSLLISGKEIPEWFTYKNSGNDSISVSLPKNWHTPTFRGFAICVVFDMMTPSIHHNYNRSLKNFQGFWFWFTLTDHYGSVSQRWCCLGQIGSEKPVGSGNTLQALVPLVMSSQFDDPNNFIQLEIGFYDCIHKDAVTKGLGVHLVYEN